MDFAEVARVPVDPETARVYESGWQSWSPATTYPVGATSYRPRSPASATMGFRAGRPGPETGFQGEGLLAVDPGDGGRVLLFAGAGPTGGGEFEVASIRAAYGEGVLAVFSDLPVRQIEHRGHLGGALATWAARYAAEVGIPAPRPAPTGWCSWYQYYTDVTEDDIVENLDEIGAAELPVDVIQIDDGWQAGIGDWTETSGRFGSLPDLVGRIRDTGRRAGIWLAPFLAGEHSRLAREHPEWLIREPASGTTRPSSELASGATRSGAQSPAGAGRNWGQRLYGLDTTHPGVLAYLSTVFSGLLDAGFEYFKLDFLYAGALDGPRHDGSGPLAAYRAGLNHIRKILGTEPYVLGCGAPLLPSAGLVDAMRVSPDIASHYEAPDGDLSMPSQAAATLSTVGRAFLHGRFWVNDPDCLIARPQVQRRERWAGVVERFGGLRFSSDRIRDLDAWGLERTRQLLAAAPPPTPLADV